MKEAIQTPYNRCVFRETFRDEQSVRRNGGTPTNITFSNGRGSFNGTSSKVNYNLSLNGTYSVRVRIRNLSYTESYASIIDFRKPIGTDTLGFVYTGSAYGTNTLVASSGIIYVNGARISTFGGVDDEIVVAGITIESVNTILGTGRGIATYRVSGIYDLFEIYQGTLTASEVKNLYENKWNKEVSGFGGQFIGSDVVTNGDFSNGSTGWTLGAGWTVSGGKANWDASGIAALTQANKFVTGKRYILSFTVSGNNATRIGLTNSGLSTTSYTIGTHNLLLTNTTTGALTFYGYSGSDLPFSLDNISLTVQEFQPDLLLDFDSTQGTIKDRTGKNTLTATAVSIKKIGQSYSADFNGTTSKIDTGTDFIGTKAITVCGWIKPYSAGEANNARILDNGKIYFSQYSGTYRFSSNYIGTATGASYSLGKLQFVAVTRTSTGIVNFYIGDTKTAPILSGIADQASGTPIEGTTNVFIGNNGGATRTFDGLIPQLKVVEGILSLEDITQIWSSTRKNYI